MRCDRNQPLPEKAFSLVELLTVIAVIAILGGLMIRTLQPAADPDGATDWPDAHGRFPAPVDGSGPNADNLMAGGSP